jgi:hypothetical protein
MCWSRVTAGKDFETESVAMFVLLCVYGTLPATLQGVQAYVEDLKAPE